MMRGGGLLFGAALAAVTIYAARKLFLANNALEDATQDGLQVSLCEWSERTALDQKSFFHGVHEYTGEGTKS